MGVAGAESRISWLASCGVGGVNQDLALNNSMCGGCWGPF